MASVGVELEPHAPDQLDEGVPAGDRVAPVCGAVGVRVAAEIVASDGSTHTLPTSPLASRSAQIIQLGSAKAK